MITDPAISNQDSQEAQSRDTKKPEVGRSLFNIKVIKYVKVSIKSKNPGIQFLVGQIHFSVFTAQTAKQGKFTFIYWLKVDYSIQGGVSPDKMSRDEIK